MSATMSPFQPILIFVAAFLMVFWQAAFPSTSHWLKTQLDLLPSLIVYASLRTNPLIIGGLAICGGLFLDTLSANPLGVTILPLAAVGTGVYFRRDLIMKDQPYAQFVLGAAASAATPLLTVLLLLTLGERPLLGWGSLWQWLVMTLAGAVATPILFLVFDWCLHAFTYSRRTDSPFRTDREIRRGKY